MIRTLLCAASILLQVVSQSDFDALPLRLEECLTAGTDSVRVEFAPGLYYYGEEHLRLEGLRRPALSLSLEGEGACLVARDPGTGYSPENGYMDTVTREPVYVRAPAKRAKFWPLRVLFRKRVFKIPCNEPDRSPEMVKGWNIVLSQWYKGAVYPVLEIRNGWLYFKRETYYGTGMWSELRFGRCLPRYVLCPVPELKPTVHVCGVSNFLTVRDCEIGEIRLEGLSFVGNREGGSLIALERVQADGIRFAGCSFLGLRSHVITADEASGVEVSHCVFREDYLSAVRILEGSRNARIVSNRFLNNGLAMSNAATVVCRGVDYLVSGNYIEDFSHSAMGLGIHYTLEDKYGTCGVVEKNEICMSEAFRSELRPTLIDGGAIYVNTGNTRTVIRDNYVHDIVGPHGNRGIFADDGAVKVEISGNRVFRIRNGYCIDLRRCFRVHRLPDSKIPKGNVGNRIYDNTFDGRSRIFVRRDDPSSAAYNNVRIR
jgi:hypothetical protein